MPARPRGRRAPLPVRPARPAHLQPGRTQPAASQTPSRRSPAGSAPRPPPATATPSGATPTPRASTARTSSPQSATPSPETPGCRPSLHEHSHARRQSHTAIENNAAGRAECLHRKFLDKLCDWEGIPSAVDGQGCQLRLLASGYVPHEKVCGSYARHPFRTSRVQVSRSAYMLGGAAAARAGRRAGGRRFASWPAPEVLGLRHG